MTQLDYALIGNCQVSALLDSKASYVWACLPRFDSSSIFASLLGGEGAGTWSVEPDGEHTAEQSYIPNTNVVSTRFHLKSGDAFEVIDFCPRFSHGDGTYYRPPQFIRMVRPLKGIPRLSMRIQPRFDYGASVPQTNISEGGLVFRHGNEFVHLKTDLSASYLVEARPFELTANRYFVLSHGETFERPLRFGCEEFYERTIAYWHRWVKHCRIPLEYQSAVIRSALALKLHVFEDTGAIIAATTTSVPESDHGGRTWDYRYCWLRDSYFVINALNQLGQFEEMERFIHYVNNILASEPSGRLQPVYGISGEKKISESIVPHLAGFKGIGPVRVGNAAYTHDQHDIYGEVVLAVAPIFFDQRLDDTDLPRVFERVVTLVEKAIEVFPQPDAGIWEVRSEESHYVFSKLLCWAAVDRGLMIAKKMGRKFPHWQEALKNMRETIENEAWNEKKGIYAQVLGGDDPDAANLLFIPLNFHPANHERFSQMMTTYEKELVRNGHVFRYLNKDDFGVPRNAFTVCTFWYVDVLAALRRKKEARAIFEKVLSSANHVGLLSEDIHVDTGELWGNFPQTYSHVGVINSAFRLSRGWDGIY